MMSQKSSIGSPGLVVISVNILVLNTGAGDCKLISDVESLAKRNGDNLNLVIILAKPSTSNYGDKQQLNTSGEGI